MSFLGFRKLFPAALDTLSYSCVSRSLCVNKLPTSAYLSIRECSSSSTNTDDVSENDLVNSVFVTRNPRNLERMTIAMKPKGWNFQYPSRTFYHRLRFQKSQRFVIGWVEHNTGRVVLTASTKEFAISRYLYSSNDVSAASNVGRVLARRCLEAGIECMEVLKPLESDDSEKFTIFCEAMLEGGVELTEPDQVEPLYEPGIDYNDEWEMADLARRQALVKHDNRTTMFKLGQKRHGMKKIR